MHCVNLQLRAFRNHTDTSVHGFAPKINVITGSNGAGKTSILEALSVAGLTKSFTGADDKSLIRSGETGFAISAAFLSELKVELHVNTSYELGPPAKKTITVNNDRLRSSAELIGRIPIVSLTPDDKAITSGSPDERRRFLNLVLSQSSSSYLKDEVEYRKALRHRNSLLGDLKQRGASSLSAGALLAPWTEMLVKFGAPVMARRARFVQEFRPYLEVSYATLSDENETPSFQYSPMGLDDALTSETDARELLMLEFKSRESEELRRGITLAGPHRDELRIFIDPEREAKRFASQGQHKTLLVAMKFAEYKFLEDATSEKPILLLDDLFSELDAERSARLLDLVSEKQFGQTFITTTTRETFDGILDMRHSHNKLVVVESGKITNS